MNRAIHIARVAAEYTQLLCHVSRARTQPCVFINEAEWVCEMSLCRTPRWLADPTPRHVADRRLQVDAVIRPRLPLHYDAAHGRWREGQQGGQGN